MNTNNKHPHFSRTVLHNGEERVKRIFRDQLAELAGLLEVGISLLVVVALMLAVVPLIKMLPGLLVDTNEVEISLFLQRALDIVIGIEFIKMLAKHSPGSALEVMAYSSTSSARWISSSASSSSRCLPSTAPAVRWKCCCMPLPAI